MLVRRPVRHLTVAVLAFALVATVSVLGCASPAPEAPAVRTDAAKPQSLPVTQLEVYADESLKAVLEQTQPTFEKLEGLKMQFTFGPTAELRAAIEDGAPADAFVSADSGQMEGLIEAGLVEQTASQAVATGEGDVRYVAAPLKGAEHRALGSIYVLYLKSPQVQQALKDAGFGPAAE
jgi:molybdate transport system substrate-binding protein